MMTDIHRSGCNELLYIKTADTAVTVRSVRGSTPAGAEKSSTVRIVSDSEYDISVMGELKGERMSGGEREYKTYPLFFEGGIYEILIESLDGGEIGFRHDDPEINSSVAPMGRSGRILSGAMSFENCIGFSDMLISHSNGGRLRITVEVLPTRLGYKEDYTALISDITREAYGLVFEVLGKTYSRYSGLGHSGGSGAEFFAVIRRIYSELVSAAEYVIKHPRHELIRTYEPVGAHRAGKADTKTLRWLEKHPEHIRRTDNGITAARALSPAKALTYDIEENRFARYVLESAAKRLRCFSEACRAMRSGAETTADEAAAMAERLERLCKTGVLGDVGKYRSIGPPDRAQTAAGYKELCRAHNLLSHGLAAAEGIFDIPLKDIQRLYSCWCFIKLNGILRSRYRLVSQDMIKIRDSGAAVVLEEGSSSQMSYIDPRNGDRIFLTFDPRQRNVPTVAQHPCIVLTLIKRGAKTRCEYAFEPCYRLGADGRSPSEADINTMHRYRDAIVYSNSGSVYARSMFGAYVLFPSHEEESYREHTFYKSIEKVNIGALPFLPSSERLAAELLDELISDSETTALERAVLPSGIEERLAKVNWNVRDVLIGVLGRTRQLDVCLEHKFYHIPSKQLAEDDFPIRYVALYQSRNMFGKDAGIRWYGEVVRCAMVRRRAIKEIPKDSDEPYYKFIIKEWKRLEPGIAPKEIGFVREFTSLFLLETCAEIPELMLRSETEYRLYMEMKRLWSGTGIEDTDTGAPVKIRARDIDMIADNGSILVCRSGTVIEKIPINTFARMPGVMFGRIRRLIGE